MYLTCEWTLNYPIPLPQQATDKLKSLSRCGKTVSVVAMAKAFEISVGAMHNVLETAAQQGLVRRMSEQEWVPLKT
jgi:hypothetical protein